MIKIFFGLLEARMARCCCFWCLLFFFACTPSEKDQGYTIGFSQCTEGDAWRQAMRAEMEREIAFHPELKLEILDAKNRNQKQIQDIQFFIEQKVDLLIVSPNEAEPITPIVEKAFNTGIPVIILDRKTTSSQYTAYLGADNYEIGKLAGKYITNLLEGQGKVIEIWGLAGSSPAIERSRGFREALASYPEIQIIHEVKGKWQKQIAKAKLLKRKAEIEEVDLIFAHNDQMALGAFEVCKALGKEKEIRFVGVDALSGARGGIQMVDDGTLDASLLYPTGGDQAVRLAAKILNKEDFKKDNTLQTTIVDSNNARVMQLQNRKILSQQEDIMRQEKVLETQRKLYRSQRNLLFILLGSLVMSLALGFLTWKALRSKQKINQDLKQKNEEILQQRNQIEEMAEEARAANEAKFKFFTNISHEFRTPLTLILAPVEEMLQTSKTLPASFQTDLKLVRKNAYRLLRLVTQLMDFRKIENQKMVLEATQSDLISFLKNIKMSFDRTAQGRAIDYQLKSNISTLNLWFDPNKLDKVLFNLLSNAFKFTQDKGLIYIEIEEISQKQMVKIRVKDNGRGMSPEHTAHAFDRFYQGESYSTLGTGLGLSLSRELMLLHHGDISVESQKGKGTCFEITLPLGQAHLASEEMSQLPTSEVSKDIATMYAEELSQVEVPSFEEKITTRTQSILLIEDNPDLRIFLRSKLSEHYELWEEADGQKGLERAMEGIPDLIVCDITLPSLNGLSITRKLKNDIRTSHIPIILLTASDTQEEQVRGMQTGADSYLIKPFNPVFLMENIRSLLHNRQILRERYQHDLLKNDTLNHVNHLDKKFLNDFISCVEKNIHDSDFQVEDICQEIGLSRVQLYRKIKSLTEYTPTDYIKEVRLKKAAQLLKKPELSIAEVAYQVGFASPAYFSTSFKSKYQVSPSEFKQQGSPKNS